MNDLKISVLLVQDEPDALGLVEVALEAVWGATFHTVWVRSIAAAVKCFRHASFDVVLLDLTLPDGAGLEAFYQVSQMAPNALVIILTPAEEEGIARQAVERGAYDYLIKSTMDGAYRVPRALQSVFENKAGREGGGISEACFRAVSDASPLGIFVADADGVCVYSNAVYCRIAGLASEQVLGTYWSAVVHPDDLQRVVVEWQAAARAISPFQTAVRLLRPDGAAVWTLLNVAPMVNDGQPYGYVEIVEDISRKKSIEQALQFAENALFEGRDHAQVTLDSIADAVLTTDLSGRISYLNPVAETMTGWRDDEAQAQLLTEVCRVQHASTRTAVANPVQQAIEEGRVVALPGNCMLIRRDGLEFAVEGSAAPIHKHDGSVSGAVIILRDAAQARAITERMLHLAQHDVLTGLPNRALLTERLVQAIGLARRRRRQVALLFLDLDYFKDINDSLGHLIGDQLLKSVAERLVSCVRTTDTVSRQGGDEFVILLSEIENPGDAANVAEKLRSAFASPHIVDGHELLVTLSLGVSVYPDDGTVPEVLMQNADTAMYQAKENGRNNYLFFKTEMCVHYGNGQGQLWSRSAL